MAIGEGIMEDVGKGNSGVVGAGAPDPPDEAGDVGVLVELKIKLNPVGICADEFPERSRNGFINNSHVPVEIAREMLTTVR